MDGNGKVLDLTFHTECGRFNYRVGAVIINDGSILMVKNDGEPYYYSVGGRVHFNETVEDAIRREIFEETGLRAEIDRPIFFHENFFIEAARNEYFHEVAVFFLIKPIKDIDKIVDGSFTDNGAKEHLEWLPIDRLSDYPIHPQFFYTELKRLPENLKFIVTDETSRRLGQP